MLLEYDGPFAPLPDDIRARHPDMFGWEHDKTRSESSWSVIGWIVVTPNNDGSHV